MRRDDARPSGIDVSLRALRRGGAASAAATPPAWSSAKLQRLRRKLSELSTATTTSTPTPPSTPPRSPSEGLAPRADDDVPTASGSSKIKSSNIAALLQDPQWRIGP
eukprot:TRINITY_DN2209_c0_g2_i1.p4 TRINITY_DN2209_c0_g2~~TRINITY_DN2209_c0_g2_i1.p4  ORF type:complete len:107 (+),score=26.03 TRINITY_DN2209_c0_g2_i1:67-387(+)